MMTTSQNLKQVNWSMIKLKNYGNEKNKTFLLTMDLTPRFRIEHVRKVRGGKHYANNQTE
jgi:hypothetical protein